jgi:hypothetical protein
VRPIAKYILLLAYLNFSLACVIGYLIAQVIFIGPPLTLDNFLFMTINAHLASALTTVRLIKYIDVVLKK